MRKKFILKMMISLLFAIGSGSFLNAQNENAQNKTISTEAELIAIATEVNNGNNSYEGITIVLTDDITLTGEWTPIGNKDSEKYFKGTFNGNGFKISGLNVLNADYGALFGATENATIENLTVLGSVQGKSVAGIVARMNGGTIDNCVSEVVLTIASTSKGGGIVCLAGATSGLSEIKNCTYNGEITIEGTTQGQAGGIIGYISNTDNVKVTGCNNNGTISSSVSATSSTYVGGIAGYCMGGCSFEISECANFSSDLSGANVGGIAGFVSTPQTDDSHIIKDCITIAGTTIAGTIQDDNPDFNPDNIIFVAKINNTYYATFQDAMTAAKSSSGDVTVEVYAAVEFVNGMELKGDYTSITFTGVNDAAKITINQTAGGDYLEAHGEIVTFKNLTLAKANPAWAGNSGHMGNYFSVQGGTVSYKDCIFLNGACTSGGTATYTDCTFENTSEYGLWVYDDALVTVNGGTINSKKGIKVYSEGETSVTSTLTVQNATFTGNVTAKPAVAVGYAVSITLIGNTYNNTTGVLELDSGADADCEGITFVAKDTNGNDISATLTPVDRSNNNARCGVLVNNKIYTTVTEAAKDVVSGDVVTLLYDTEETVELPAGVELNTNNYTADGVTVVPTITTINSADDLKKFAESVNKGNTYEGKTVTLTTDIELSGEWTPIGNGVRSSKTYTGKAFKGTFDGSDKTISGLTITSTTNADAAVGLFGVVDGGTVKNLKLTDVKINVSTSDLAGGAIGMLLNNGTAENITVSGAVTGYDGVGGIVGRMIISGTISNCENNAAVTSSYGGIGGIVGKAYYEDGDNTSIFSNISNCTNNGTITAPMYLGGIVGLARSNVSGCINNGKIVGTNNMVGGIIGQLMAAGTVSNNENKAKVSGASQVGGIIGSYTQSESYTYNNVSIISNTNRGEVAFTTNAGGAAIMGCNNIDGFMAMTATKNLSYYYVEGLELFGNPEDMVIDDTNQFIIVYVAQIGETKYTTIQAAVNAASTTGETVITLLDGNIDGDVNITIAAVGEQKGNIKFVAAEGAKPVITGTVTLGYYEKGVGAENWEASVSFKGIAFDHAESAKHSIDVQSVDGLFMTDCTITGDGEYGIGSAAGNNTTNSTITGCTFTDAGMQVLGNFGTGLVIDDCTFNNSCINVQGGNLVTIKDSTFDCGLNTTDNWYVIRSNDNAIEIKGCKFNVNSDLEDSAAPADGKAWAIFWQRQAGNTKWTMTNIEVNLTDAAMAQTELLINKNGTTDAANAEGRVTITGLTSTSNNVADLVKRSEGYMNANGKLYKDGSIASLAGEGTQEKPYLISDVEDLKFFRDEVNKGNNNYVNKYVKLTGNIDLEQNDWVSIGTKNYPFQGTFDGDGHTISNLWSYERGLFGYTSTGNYGDNTGNRATIKNLTLNGAEVYNQEANAVGAVIGQANMNTVVDNVNVTGKINVYGYGYVGGIVGQGYTQINNCHIDGYFEADDCSHIDANYWAVGGIIGHAGAEGGTTITNCSVKNVDIRSTYYGAGSIFGVGTEGKIENITAESVKVVANSNPNANGLLGGYAYGSIDGDSYAKSVTLIVDGELIENYQDIEAKIGDTYYASLQTAFDEINKANGGDIVIEILKEELNLSDWEGYSWNSYSATGANNVEIKGNNVTLTGMTKPLFLGTWTGQTLKISNITIKEPAIVLDEEDQTCTTAVGAFVANVSCNENVILDNCDVTGGSIKGGHWTGGLIGYATGYSNQNNGPVFTTITITNCDITGVEISGKGSAGGIVGHATGDAWTMFGVESANVENCNITSTGSDTNKAGSIMGTIGAAGQITHDRLGGVSVSATTSNNTVTSNNTIITTIYGRQGSDTGVLTLTEGGSYEAYPIEKDKLYAVLAEGYALSQGVGNSWSVIPAQSFSLQQGWNWFSSYVDLSGAEGLSQLQDSLAGNATIIKNKTQFTVYGQNSNDEYGWTTTGLTSLSNTEMYMISMNADKSISLTGNKVDLTTEIDLSNWAWIPYLLDGDNEVEDVFNGIANNGDHIKGHTSFAMCYEYNEALYWYGTLNTMEPGQGYIYNSTNDAKLKYSEVNTGNGKGELKANVTTENNRYRVNARQYPSNMNIVATLNVNGEMTGEDYEVAAFVNGECRGSARPIYVEPLDTYMFFLTIHGDDVEQVTFRYIDLATGEEYALNERISYSNDAVLGTIAEPYVLSRGTMGIDGMSANTVNIYPNPTTTDKEISLQTTCDKVEVFNALGLKIAEYQNVDTIDAFETAGIYVIRITDNNSVQHCRLIVK